MLGIGPLFGTERTSSSCSAQGAHPVLFGTERSYSPYSAQSARPVFVRHGVFVIQKPTATRVSISQTSQISNPAQARIRGSILIDSSRRIGRTNAEVLVLHSRGCKLMHACGSLGIRCRRLMLIVVHGATPSWPAFTEPSLCGLLLQSRAFTPRFRGDERLRPAFTEPRLHGPLSRSRAFRHSLLCRTTCVAEPAVVARSHGTTPLRPAFVEPHISP